MVNYTFPWNVAPFKKPARTWWDMAVLAWDMVIERSPPKLAAPLSGARLERDVWSVLNPGVDRGPDADTPGKGCSWRNAPPVPKVHVARGLWTAGWVADYVNISDRFAGTPCVCSSSLMIIKRCGTKIMAQTRLLPVTSNGTDVFWLYALTRQHSDRGVPKTMVRINCTEFSSQRNPSHHGVQCVDTNLLVFIPHPRLLETRTRPLPKVIIGRVQLGHILFKWRHRAYIILHILSTWSSSLSWLGSFWWFFVSSLKTTVTYRRPLPSRLMAKVYFLIVLNPSRPLHPNCSTSSTNTLHCKATGLSSDNTPVSYSFSMTSALIACLCFVVSMPWRFSSFRDLRNTSFAAVKSLSREMSIVLW